MASLNRVILIGNLTKDPELRVTPNGTSVSTIRLAINRRRPSSSGEAANNTDYFNVVVWGKSAELCQEYLKKGSPVAIDGRLQSRAWETQDGQRRSTVEVVAENVQFLWRPGASDSRGSERDFEGVSPKPADTDAGQDFPDEVPF